MTAAEFAANLRAALPVWSTTFTLSDVCPFQKAGISFYRARCLFYGRDDYGQPIDLPTPAEITSLATALGCPEERLTVSREELEAERDDLVAHLRYERELRREDIRGKVAYRDERDALRARVAELEAEVEKWKSVTCEQHVEILDTRARASSEETTRRHMGDKLFEAEIAESRLAARVRELEAELAEERERRRRIIEG